MNDRLHTLAVGILGAVALVSLAGAIVLSGLGKPAPDLLSVALGASLGGVTGIFVPAPGQRAAQTSAQAQTTEQTQ